MMGRGGATHQDIAVPKRVHEPQGVNCSGAQRQRKCLGAFLGAAVDGDRTDLGRDHVPRGYVRDPPRAEDQQALPRKLTQNRLCLSGRTLSDREDARGDCRLGSGSLPAPQGMVKQPGERRAASPFLERELQCFLDLGHDLVLAQH